MAFFALAFGISGGIYMAIARISENTTIGAAAATVGLTLFLALCYVHPCYCAHALERLRNCQRKPSVLLFQAKESPMPRGGKSKYTSKQKRKAHHIEEGYEKRGVSSDEAARRAYATINKYEGGGKKSGSGSKRKKRKSSSSKRGRKTSGRRTSSSHKRKSSRKSRRKG